MTYWLSVFLLIAHVTVAAAGQQQGVELSGVIRDALGLPIPGLEVALSGPSASTSVTTNGVGEYRFDVEPGEYRLTARRAGFREWSRDVVVQADVPVHIDAELQPNYTETTIVSASRGHDSLLTAPAAVSVLTSEYIEASAADNFADLLRGVPGLSVVQLGARDVNVNARGATGILSNSMLVMVDGRSLFQPLYGAVYWDLATVQKEEIDQIEILRTPASALWGANALSGVINIRTKSPRQLAGLRGEFGAGERGTMTIGASWADSTPSVSYKVSGSYFEQDAWKRDNVLPDGSPMPPTALFENRGAKQPKVDARIDWDADQHRVSSLRGGVAGGYGHIYTAIGPAEFQSHSYASYLEFDHTRDDTDVKLYWNRFHAPFRFVLFGLDEGVDNDTFVGEFTRRARIGRHSVAAGGSVRLDHFDITIAPDDHGRIDAAAFVEDKITVNHAVTVVAGGRLDKFDTTGAVFAPRVSVVLTPAPNHSFRLSYNRAYRAPSLVENFVNLSLPAYVPLDRPFFYTQYALGSTDLAMEKQDAGEIGYTAVIGSRAVVTATAYRQRIRDDIWFLPISFYSPIEPPPGWPGSPGAVPFLPKVFSFVNIAELSDRGIELATNVEWAKVALQGSYTFQDTPRLKSAAPFPLQVNRPAKHQAGGGVMYKAERWTAAGDLHFTDRAFWADVLDAPFWGSTNSYVAVNAHATYRPHLQPWELWVSSTDLFDRKIKTHVFGDTLRRKITAGIRWRWQG